MKENGNINVIEPKDDFKRIHKSIIRNQNIDCLTLGIYCKIVVLGVDWQLNIKGLSKVLGVSDKKVSTCIGILEKEGYIKRKPNYHDHKLDGWIYDVFPEPISEEERSRAGYKKETCNEQSLEFCAEPFFSVTQNKTTLKQVMSENGEDNNIRLNIIEDLNKKEEKEIDKSISKSNKELFEECWLSYNRKGSKKKALEQWQKISDETKVNILTHIKAYVGSRDRQFQKDFERYLRDKTFNDVVYKGNSIIYDPMVGVSDAYMPATDGAIKWNEANKCYIYIGMFFGYIPDGYTDDNRPNHARIMLNNGGGMLVWNSETKKWNKI